jgi:hypothetical protein
MHKKRVITNEKYNSLLEMFQLDYDVRNKKTLSLIESKRKEEYQLLEATRNEYQDLLKDTEESLNKLDDDEKIIDVLLDETAHIATDLTKLLEAKNSSSFVYRNH